MQIMTFCLCISIILKKTQPLRIVPDGSAWFRSDSGGRDRVSSSTHSLSGIPHNEENDPSEKGRDKEREQCPSEWITMPIHSHPIGDMDTDEIDRQQRQEAAKYTQKNNSKA